jgi:EAL domain-containing protein (putative c-di-GMP-specific phosphodiesterase class I)
MLSGFGGNNCPMMRLAEFRVDYVMLSPEVAYFIDRSKRADEAVKSIIGFVTDLEAEPIADGIQNSHQAETLYGFECRYCAGSLAGEYQQERYIHH